MKTVHPATVPWQEHLYQSKLASPFYGTVILLLLSVPMQWKYSPSKNWQWADSFQLCWVLCLSYNLSALHFSLNLSTSYEFLHAEVLFDIVLLITLQTHNCKDIKHTADGHRLRKGKVYNLSVNLTWKKLLTELQLYLT